MPKFEISLVRKILLILEENPEFTVPPSVIARALYGEAPSIDNKKELEWHLQKMVEGELLTEQVTRFSTYDGDSEVRDWVRIHYAGHQFLGALRSDTVFNRVKSKVEASVGSTSISEWVFLGSQVVRTLLQQ